MVLHGQFVLGGSMSIRRQWRNPGVLARDNPEDRYAVAIVKEGASVLQKNHFIPHSLETIFKKHHISEPMNKRFMEKFHGCLKNRETFIQRNLHGIQ